MPTQVATRTAIAALTVCACAAPASRARAETSATITPSISPDRLGARAALTFTIHYTGGEFGVPSPVRRSVLRFPAGLTLDLPSLRTCSPARLRARGADGCPPQSQLGRGHALAEVRAGSQTITENVVLWAFLGPPRNLQPTLEILGQGYTPFDERVVLTGTALPDRAPYGEELVIRIPPIPTLPLEPDASIVTLSLTIGAKGHRASANTVVVPPKCPPGGFPFASEFTYADGTSGSALATARCPS
ncbi:MAG TPA: hypothetical protein VES97_09060 [Solirubrobacteraceae bacterium]|nr:hypothetical protein [Solirubrobacteraceae bacterium]